MTQRTYWHLDGLGRRPTDYEIASSRLMYHAERGFEVRGPLAESLERRSKLAMSDWGKFRDPRQTTYALYTHLQRTKEAFGLKLCRSQTIQHRLNGFHLGSASSQPRSDFL